MEYENYFRAFHFMVGALRENEKAGRVTDVVKLLAMVERHFGIQMPAYMVEQELKQAA